MGSAGGDVSLVTLILALSIGISIAEGAITPMQILVNADVIKSLFYGGLAACVLFRGDAAVEKENPRRAGWQGPGLWGVGTEMLMAAAVLFLAWMTADDLPCWGSASTWPD